VRIDPGPADSERVLDLSYNGPSWRARKNAVEAALRDGVAR